MADEKLTKELTLKNKYGMHVRPAGLFAKIASRFNADVEVEKDGNVVSGKSIMALMTLVCYRYSGKESIVEDIRNETV